MQQSGQTPFYIAYDDLNQLDHSERACLPGWACPGRLSAIDDTLKPQNPDPALAKVTNPEEMEQALSQIDSFNLHSTPNFEPRRRPYAVANYMSRHAKNAADVHANSRGDQQNTVVSKWMATLDGVDVDQLLTNQNRKQTRSVVSNQSRTSKIHRAATSLGAGTLCAFASIS